MTVSADLRTAFDEQIDLGRATLDSIASDDPKIVNAARLMSAMRSFTRAQQTADLAHGLGPVRDCGKWVARQNQALGYVNATSRRLAEMIDN